MKRRINHNGFRFFNGAGWFPIALLVTTGAVMMVAIYMIFIYAPTEAIQGEIQRIFYGHVSMALVAYISYLLVFIGGALYLAKRSRRWDRLARSAAIIGVVFTTLVLLTGCLWGTRVWGACWTWDARLTTTLILWFIYVGYLMLRGYVKDPEPKRRLAAIVGTVGFVVVPINYLSVYWWRTLHPIPTIIRSEGPSLPPPMFATLIVTVAAFILLYMVLIRHQLALEKLVDELEDLRYRRLFVESTG